MRSLRHEDVFILASGGATHNLYAFGEAYHATPPDWVQEYLTLPAINRRGFLVQRVHLDETPCSISTRGGSLLKL